MRLSFLQIVIVGCGLLLAFLLGLWVHTRCDALAELGGIGIIYSVADSTVIETCSANDKRWSPRNDKRCYVQDMPR